MPMHIQTRTVLSRAEAVEKTVYFVMPADKRPSSPAQAIKECDEDMFANIHVLLKIAGILPIRSCNRVASEVPVLCFV